MQSGRSIHSSWEDETARARSRLFHFILSYVRTATTVERGGRGCLPPRKGVARGAEARLGCCWMSESMGGWGDAYPKWKSKLQRNYQPLPFS